MGGKFVIRTDHISLKYLLEQKLNTSIQHKGLSKLLGLDYVIEYKKGSENKVADALSRVNNTTELMCVCDAGLNAIVELKPHWVKEVHNSYQHDKWIEGLLQQVQNRSTDGSGNTTQTEGKHISQHMGIIRWKGRICVGNHGNWREMIIKELHDSTVGGHSGIIATYHRVKKLFYWPNIKNNIHQFIQNCDNC